MKNCGDLIFGCGDHGSCEGLKCNCENGWSGTFCNVPPITPCTSNKDCGNYGSYGVCNQILGVCTNCPPGRHGSNCQKYCSTKDDCGGSQQGVCIDEGLCSCINGWSGNNCEIPPPNWKCKEDSQCNKPYGQCDSKTGKCNCQLGYSGLTCKNQNPPDPSTKQGLIEYILLGLENMLSSVDGIALLAAFMIKGKFEKFIINSLEGLKENLGEFATKIADEILSTASKEFSEMTVEDVVNSIIIKNLQKFLIGSIIETIGIVIPILELIEELMEIIQIMGMIIDSQDYLGLNEEMTNSYIELFRIGMYGVWNTNQKSIENNFLMPMEYIPLLNQDFNKLIHSTKYSSSYTKYFREYISNLEVNSNGNKIIIIGERKKNNKSITKWLILSPIILFLVIIIFLNIFNYN